MYRMPVILGKIRHIFDYDHRSKHYSAYYTATCQNKKLTSHGMSFYNLFFTIRSVDQQKKLFAKDVDIA